MSVLKDAAAAIYGARAANGVILITTKHGKTGKPKCPTISTRVGRNLPYSPKCRMPLNMPTIVNELTLFGDVPSNQWTAAWTAFKAKRYLYTHR